MEEIKQWKHKESGKIYRVLPWWECHGTIIDKPESILKDTEDDWKDRQYRIGILAQVGWLLENDNNLWIGMGPTAREAFEDYIESTGQDSLPNE